ncbi:MAG: AAA family ATPase [Myxococcales bacterium]
MTTAPALSEHAPFDVVRAVDLQRSPKEQRWLVDALWAEQGVGFIGGTPKSLKSWVGLDLAVAVASGTCCLGHFRVRRPGTALVYLAEDRLDVVRERLEALAAARTLLLATLDIRVITTPALRLDLDAHCRRLEATLADNRPRLLLLDPLVRLHRADENNAQEVAAILATLRELQRRFQLAVVLVHHTRKTIGSRQIGQALRGSGDLHAWADSALYLSHEQAGLRLTIEQRAAPAPDPCYIRLASRPPHPVLTAPEQDQRPTLQDRLLDTLQRSAKPITRTELRRLLAVQNNRLGEALKNLEALGRIRRTPKGWSC